MARYFITWEIDIEASSAYEAACFARDIQQNPDSTATVFRVQEHEASDSVQIDLLESEADNG